MLRSEDVIREKIKTFGKLQCLLKLLEEVDELRIDLCALINAVGGDASQCAERKIAMSMAREWADLTIAGYDTMVQIYDGFDSAVDEKRHYVYETHLPREIAKCQE